MTEKETKDRILKRIEKLESRFEEKYELFSKPGEKKCFYVNDGEYFMVTGLVNFGSIVIEHALSKRDAERNMFEDGDLFYLDELDEDAMFEAMIREIEEN